MRDLIELASTIDKELPPKVRKEKFCDLFLKEIQTLKGGDLAPYLSEFVFDALEPGERIVLKFPMGAHIFDTVRRDTE